MISLRTGFFLPKISSSDRAFRGELQSQIKGSGQFQP